MSQEIMIKKWLRLKYHCITENWKKMGQFIWVLMWNDMPNQKVVFESFLILHQNMFQVQV